MTCDGIIIIKRKISFCFCILQQVAFQCLVYCEYDVECILAPHQHFLWVNFVSQGIDPDHNFHTLGCMSLASLLYVF